MKNIAKCFLFIDQRLYDILGIVLIGTAGNIIVGSAGRDDEYELLVWGLACVLSGGITMFLRGRRAAIEFSADVKRLLNKQAVLTKLELLALNNPVPEDVESRASAAQNTRSQDIRKEIDIALAMKTDVCLVLAAVIASALLAVCSFGGIMARLYGPANSNIQDIIESTTTTSYEMIVDHVGLLRDEVESLSVLLNSNSTRTVETVTAGQIETSKAISALRSEIIALSVSRSNLGTEASSPPPPNGGHSNKRDRKRE